MAIAFNPMPCLRPIKGWYPRPTAPDARLVFDVRFAANPDRFTYVSCGQCICCRLYASQGWAVRCMHEKRMHAKSCFLTLTYSPEHLPKYGSLIRDAVPEFNKRLRDYLNYPQLSFFYCGEYGDMLHRPHYHEIVFGYDPPDKKFWKRVRGNDYFTSEILNARWGLGNVVIGNVDFDSAAYVARYTLKKQKRSDKVIGSFECPVTGEYHDARLGDVFSSDIFTRELQKRLPVFAGMSTNPAIGLRFIEAFPDDVFAEMSTVFKTHEFALPRYYLKRLEKVNPAKYLAFKATQKLFSKPPDFVRLKAREEIVLSRIKPLTRSLDQ